MKFIFSVSFFIVIISFLSATIINVPGDQPTIQEGINVAVDGDTVLVHPSIYFENINFNGKNITVASLFLTTQDTIFISQTIIDGNQNENTVTFENQENHDSKLIGLSIINEFSNCYGIKCHNASPIINNNYIISTECFGIYIGNSSVIIMDNKIYLSLRGISIGENSAPRIINNELYENRTGISLFNDNSPYSSPYIYGNDIVCDTTTYSKGIYLYDYIDADIINNKISNANCGIKITHGSHPDIIGNIITNCTNGIYISSSSNVDLINNTITYNNGYGIYTNGITNDITISNCIIWENNYNFQWNYHPIISNSCINEYLLYYAIDNGGNITNDPCFIDPENGDYGLQVISPCIDAGTIDTTGLFLPEYDLAGNPRITDGNGDNSLIIDMGCYETETVTDPGFISGTIFLTGGTGNVEDVNVGVGAPVHPDENGDYLITIGTGASQYDVTAWLDYYYPQTIYNVPIESGQITENINFELEHFEPDDILTISPDSLTYLTIDEVINGHEVKLKNISCFDIWIFYLFTYEFQFYYYPYDLFPYELTQNDSLLFTIYMDLPTDFGRFIAYDTLYIETNHYTYSLPVIYDTIFLADVSDENISSNSLELYQNFPNPFNPTTTISFTVTQNAVSGSDGSSFVTLEIYNIKGQKVKTLVNEALPAGEHSVVWDGKNANNKTVATGIYFYNLKIGNKSLATRKCLLLK
jgi:parallel beta-helix repeat protein